MAAEIVHPVPVDEAPAYVRATQATFLQDPDAPGADLWVRRAQAAWEPDRTWGARQHGRWVATLRTEPRRLTLPGPDAGTEDVVVDAVTAVTVAPTQRRQGLMRAMLSAALGAARARGDALSILVAAEWAIYGRFGYAPATFSAEHVLDRSRAGTGIAGDLGRVRQLEREAFAELAPEIFAAARRRRAGQVDRDGSYWRLTLDRGSPRSPVNFVIHDGDRGPDGFVAWRPTRAGGLTPPLGAVTAELHAAAPTAERDLWAYLSGLDGVDQVNVGYRPLDDPARWWLADGRALLLSRPVDFLWLKILDVPVALCARRYGAPGELAIEVTGEAVAVDVAGRYRLHADGDEVSCETTSAPPELAIDQRALASLYLGGYRVHELRAAGLITELVAGAAGRAAAMFATPLAPWNATGF